MTEADNLLTRLAELINAGAVRDQFVHCKPEDIATVARNLLCIPGALTGRELLDRLAREILLRRLTRTDLGDENSIAIVRRAINALH